MKQFVLVAHGSPSDPEPPEAVLQALADDVRRLMPGQVVRAGTLAAAGALEAAFNGLDAPVVYPFFMAEGWFTRREVPRRLEALGITAQILRPFGFEPDLPDLITTTTLQAAQDAGLDPRDTNLVLVAHGSRIAGKSRDSGIAMAATLSRITPFQRVIPAFIEEAPFIADVAREAGSGICLPFFALRAGHVMDDIPEALETAGFRGPLLPAIGEHPKAATLIAQALQRVIAKDM